MRWNAANCRAFVAWQQTVSEETARAVVELVTVAYNAHHDGDTVEDVTFSEVEWLDNTNSRLRGVVITPDGEEHGFTVDLGDREGFRVREWDGEEHWHPAAPIRQIFAPYGADPKVWKRWESTRRTSVFRKHLAAYNAPDATAAERQAAARWASDRKLQIVDVAALPSMRPVLTDEERAAKRAASKQAAAERRAASAARGRARARAEVVRATIEGILARPTTLTRASVEAQGGTDDKEASV